MNRGRTFGRMPEGRLDAFGSPVMRLRGHAMTSGIPSSQHAVEDHHVILASLRDHAIRRDARLVQQSPAFLAGPLSKRGPIDQPMIVSGIVSIRILEHGDQDALGVEGLVERLEHADQDLIAQVVKQSDRVDEIKASELPDVPIRIDHSQPRCTAGTPPALESPLRVPVRRRRRVPPHPGPRR